MKNHPPCKACSSTNVHWVRYVMKNKRIQLRVQCYDCGRLHLDNHKFSSVEDINKVPFMDEELRENFYDKVNQKRDLKKEMFENGDSYYNEVYLKSDEWRRKRNHIISRDSGKCVICDKTNNLNVHHITYNHVYNEPSEHLLTVCRDCHENIHSDTPVIKDGLKYNYGYLNICQGCMKLHNDNSKNRCYSCAGYNYSNEEARQTFRVFEIKLKSQGDLEDANVINRGQVYVSLDGDIIIHYSGLKGLSRANARKTELLNHFRKYLSNDNLRLKIILNPFQKQHYESKD